MAIKEVEIIAKSKGKPDVKGTAPQAETWGDAVKIAKGEKEALALFNRQVKTDALNKLRVPSSGGLGRLVSKLPDAAKEEVKKIAAKYGVKLD